jgi:nitroreductase
MIEAVRTRRSVRKFTGRDVEDEFVLQLLESARLAPSGHNTQPWRFIVVRSPETKRALAKAARGQSWMEAAPVFIVCVADVRCRIQDEPGLEVNETSPQFALKQVIRDTAIAVEHVVLEAESLGLGTCWVAWYEQADVRPILGIPADKFVVAILPLGYPAETPGERPRKKLEEIVMFEKWEERSGKA